MFQQLLERIALKLKGCGLSYMLIGGQAVLLYGEPRLTKDIDITLGAGPEKLDQVLEVAHDLGLRVLVESPQQFVRQTMVLPCLEPESGIRIDFILSTSLYEQQALKRVRLVKIGKAEVHFTSPEDLIIHKVIAGRPRDLEDVKSVLLKNPGIDLTYIRQWLREFSTDLGEPFEERLVEALREIQ
jgi:predicted nucleotidyltransferase